MKRLAKWLVILLVVVAAVLVGLLLFNPLLLLPDGESVEAVPLPETTEVALRDLEEEFEATGNLEFVDSFTVVGSTPGTLSEIRASNTALNPGDVLYVRDDQPIVFFAGSVPAWRTMSVDDEGLDVRQLEQNLVNLGYADTSDLTVDATFTTATQSAVERWQEDLGVSETGIVARDAVVFGSEKARVGSVFASVGSSTDGTRMMTIAATERKIVFDLTADQRLRLDVGDEVSARLPDRSRVPATVAEFTPTGDGAWEAEAVVDGPTADLPIGDVVPVTVSWNDVVAVQAKTVPASAVLRLDSGQYVVEVVNGEIIRSVPVEVGERFGTFVEISGEINEGERVIAP